MVLGSGRGRQLPAAAACRRSANASRYRRRRKGTLAKKRDYVATVRLGPIGVVFWSKRVNQETDRRALPGSTQTQSECVQGMSVSYESRKDDRADKTYRGTAQEVRHLST